MSKNRKQKNTSWLTYNIDMPDVLVPVYDLLQDEYDRILLDTKLMNKIRQVPLEQRRGDYWRDLREIIGDGFKTWNLGANAWYARLVYENLRRLLESGRERRIVHDVLANHDNEVNQDVWDELHERGCYPKYGVIRNVKREIDNGSFTDVPTNATFVLDYTAVSDTAIQKTISKNRWLFRTSTDSWLDIEVMIPKSARRHATGKIAKPRFMKRKRDGKYVGCISYEVENDEQHDSARILGVDLGKVKPFSASALGTDGQVSCEYLISHRTQRLVGKLDRVEDALTGLLEKQSRCDGLEHSEKYVRREREIELVRRKRRNLRCEIVRFIAADIVSCALVEDCGEIHVENLSWLDSRGGRWNHSEVIAALSDLAPLFGLRVSKVNAAFSSCESPFGDGEVGTEVGRDVVFGDGWRVDRDFLASVNIASRAVGPRGRKSKSKVGRRKVDGELRYRKPCSPVRASRKVHRECVSDIASCAATNDVDYSDYFYRGSIDVVVFSAGVGGLASARSIKWMADTENNANVSDAQDLST